MTTLQYDIKLLVDKIDNLILLKARNIKKDGESDFKQLSIVDHKFTIKDKLEEISTKIFDKITSPISRTLLEERFEFDALVEPPEPAEGEEEAEPTNSGKIVFRFELPEKSDSGTTKAILRAIEDVMVTFCIYEWLYHGNYDYRKEEERYTQRWDDLLSLITRRINLKRTYKLY
jgi:hypothetical protein